MALTHADRQRSIFIGNVSQAEVNCDLRDSGCKSGQLQEKVSYSSMIGKYKGHTCITKSRAKNTNDRIAKE